MSLNNKESANQNVSTVYIEEVIRSPRNESFGESTVNDFEKYAGVAAGITNSVYRKKAIKAIQKRNKICQEPSEYLAYLANANVGNNVSFFGNMAESNLFQFIINYCKLDIMVHKRNVKYGNKSVYLENKMKNAPAADASQLARIGFCNSILFVHRTEMLVHLRNKMLKGTSEKIESKLNNPPQASAKFIPVACFCGGLVVNCFIDVIKSGCEAIKRKIHS